MRSRGQLVIGSMLVFWGLITLIGAVFNINLWTFFWPLLLIAIGLWLLLRPRLFGNYTRFRFFGDINRYGAWQVNDQEIWGFIGDVDLDMTAADIPLGETNLRIFGFIGSVILLAPEEVGVSVSSTAFVTNARVLEQKQDGFLFPVNITSDNYANAERRINLETYFFISDLKVKQV